MDHIIQNVLLSSEFSYKDEFLKISSNISDEKFTKTISSGIGDILLTKLVERTDKRDKIYYNISHLLNYKPKPDCYTNIVFNYYLLKKLFSNIVFYYNPKFTIENIYNTINLCDVKDYDLSTFFNIQPKQYDNYIVFHTKIRFGVGVNSPICTYKKILKDFFKEIRTDKKLILLGEQIIAENNATKALPSITTIYDELLELNTNNTVIDLTEKFMYNTPKMEKFEKDLSIIKHADCNIGLGHGGQFCINLCFSEDSLYFVEPGLINFKINNEKMVLVQDLKKFIEIIKCKL